MTAEPVRFRAGREPRAPIVISVPHCGTEVPPDVAASFADEAIAALPMTDWHVDELYSCAPDLGIDLFAARYSRFVVDLNRSPDAAALYPGRFETGLVPVHTFAGDKVFATPPSAELVATRCEQFHRPYHRRLSDLLDEKAADAGTPVVLIDAHSVISAANRIHGPLEQEIYLGDRDGSSCPAWLTDEVATMFGEAGLRVARNAPYKGGYTTATYGALDHVYALQIEMCQRVYMAEDDPQGAPAHPRFAAMRSRLASMLQRLREVVENRLAGG